MKRLGLDKHVKFLGFISEEEKYQYYKSCKIVVVPSRWDCQPDAPLVAAASGKPVVASRIGGIRDTVEDGKTGFLFKSENIEDLADKIVTLLKDEELREEMGNAAKEKANDIFAATKLTWLEEINKYEKKTGDYFQFKKNAIENIRVENIRKSKLKSLGKEKMQTAAKFQMRKNIAPKLDLYQVAYVEFV